MEPNVITRNGTELDHENLEQPGQSADEEVVSVRPVLAPDKNGAAQAEAAPALPERLRLDRPHRDVRPVLAVFCFESPGSFVGQYVGHVAGSLAARGTAVHVFTRGACELAVPGVTVHDLGPCGEGGVLEQVQEFTRRACEAFAGQFPGGGPVTLLGHDWSSVPALSLLREHTGGNVLLSIHSLERQRSDVTSDLAKRIEQIEHTGLREATAVLTHQPGVAEIARYWVPGCADRLNAAREPFPVHRFTGVTDPGVIKARYQVGPIDPTILYVGALDERHGPDVLMKTVPAVLKNHKQARFVFVGDGDLYWPLRVHARYLLLEHAVRLVGHLEGPPLYELIQAADVVVVPSREHTEWWPFQAAWAARKPVVVSHPAAGSFLEHEKDSVLIYPHESSCVWGVERVLFNAALAAAIARCGRERLEERFGWPGVAEQVEGLMAVKQPG